MPGFLKQSTASQSRALGPFVDDTDFKTPETALTINNTDIKLVVNGGASANKNSGGGTHRVNGVYGITFDATDTATVGEMEVSVVVSGALPVFDKFFVLEEAVYDALFAASAAGYAAVANIPTAIENADALLKRDMSAVTGEAARSPLNALRWLRNKFTNSGGTLTVFKEDDVTTAWTSATTQTATNPTTASDPT
jgi:hypothetical protein